MAFDYFNGYTSDQTPSIYDVATRQALAKQLLSNTLAPAQMDSPLSVLANALTSASSNYQNQQAATESQAGLDSSTKQLAAALANPNDPNAIAALASNPFDSAGAASVGSTLAGEQTPEGQLALQTGQANLGLINSKINGGFYGDDPTSIAMRIVQNGDDGSTRYAEAYNMLYGPHTTSTPGPEGAPIVQTIQQPIPRGVTPPGGGGISPLPTLAAAGLSGAAAATTPTVTPTPGGGSVVQTGDQLTRQNYNSNRAVAVAAPALDVLHATMGAFLDPQNRAGVAVPGELGPFLESDDGKKALDSINAIANTVASAQSLDVTKVEDELTPKPNDSPAMLAFRLQRADEYVKGLSMGNQTAAAQAAVNQALAAPSSLAASTTAPVPLAPLPDPATAGLTLPGQQSAPAAGGWKILSVQ